jgi:hypothetical protein
VQNWAKPSTGVLRPGGGGGWGGVNHSTLLGRLLLQTLQLLCPDELFVGPSFLVTVGGSRGWLEKVWRGDAPERRIGDSRRPQLVSPVCC